MSGIMNDADKTNIDASTQELMNVVFEATKKLLDNLIDGQRTTIRDVIDKVVAETKVQVSVANGLVPMYIHNYPGVEVAKGRRGGIFKGKKPIRIDTRPRCETCHQVIRVK